MDRSSWYEHESIPGTWPGPKHDIHSSSLLRGRYGVMVSRTSRIRMLRWKPRLFSECPTCVAYCHGSSRVSVFSQDVTIQNSSRLHAGETTEPIVQLGPVGLGVESAPGARFV